jgi:uncharacterized membrane protein YcaP (DUF421 family)
MDVSDLVLTALRATLVYFFLLVVIRLLGKRSVGALSAFDLVVALMLGEVVDEAIYGDVSVPKGMVAITVIALWHFVNSWLGYRSATVDRLTEGEPSVLVEDGAIDTAALARERLSERELLAQLRMTGVDDVREVKRATLEASGHISVLKKHEARPLRKCDLQELLPRGRGGSQVSA